MKYIVISDDKIDFKTSKWLLEGAVIAGCDRFSLDFDSVSCATSIRHKEKLRQELEPYYMGEAVLEKLIVYRPNPFFQKQEIWKLNRDSKKIIMSHMGRNLLDWNKAINSGILNWRFYVKEKLRAGSAYQDDYFIFYDMPEFVLEVLKEKNVLTSEGNAIK
ncbi:hypothetical protein [Pseudoalteromonas obscura]|uniref:Uncharacterized protein n=2 Tax=Pseudoalteromonas TaxID=53246 RepID=A0ABT7EFG5_9GAMM|nr:hypothetical protein [Pseudoalteromonas sp. P94(2023)]MDK2594027.1 hypothetical protein [Pseudoalteromonas sp. P94(2023)]